MNPYASFLGTRDPLQVAAETPGRLSDLAKKLGSSGMERSYAAGKWPARAILCHLADCEVVFAFRFRQALAEPRHVIQPFDQDAWARVYSSPDLSGVAAIDAFSAVRHWNLALLKDLPPAVLSKPVTHPERGSMTFKVLLETMAGHDLNHLRQLDAIAAAAA
ncbi:MAG TPA: DinB family protein [Terriglobales bacterium]|nr:DinB family protein [Terriglobales bacterium]